jgi:integrase
MIAHQINQAAGLLAGGMLVDEVTAKLHLRPNTIKWWQRGYPDLWKAAMDRAMGVAAAIVKNQAGTDAVLDDPPGQVRRAAAATRWAAKNGIEVFRSGDMPTLVTFFRDYFAPMRLADGSPATIAAYEVTLRRWKAITGDPPLAEITNTMLLHFKECLTQLPGRHGAASPNTIRRHLRHIQTILNKAGPPGWHNRDAAGLIPTIPWIRPPREQLGLPKIVDEAVLNAAYMAASSMDLPTIPGVSPTDWWRALLVLAYNTGLRRRSLFELEWSFIDWHARLIAFAPSNMKSGRGHVVPLNDIAADHLRRIRTDQRLVFEWPQSTKRFHLAFHQLQTAAGIPRDKHFGLHNLRKTHATLMWAENPEAAQLQLGHSGADVTIRHYVAAGGIIARALDHLPQPEAFTHNP